MALGIRRTTGVFLAAVGLAIATSAVTAGAASAATSIREAPCNNPGSVHVHYHIGDMPVRSDHDCFANAGTFKFTCCNPHIPQDQCFKDQCWLDEIDTGNNRVKYQGDGKWLPSRGINKHTHYTFPHHPGGVKFDAIKILS